MPTHNDETLEAAIREVLRRASLDCEFRALAVRDAAAALAEVSGVRPPHDARLQFVDNSGPQKTIILPDFVPGPEDLSQSELDQVSGGCDIATCLLTM